MKIIHEKDQRRIAMTMEMWRPTRGLTPWSPFRELEEMERRLDEVFERLLLPSINPG